jgi:YHS domain-containing protein
MCPIGKEPIVLSAGTVEYKGKTIGICCPGCGKQFLAWDEARKDEFVALAVAGREPGMEHADQAKPDGEVVSQEGAEIWTDPYPLDTCPVSGQRLGSMGDPIVKKYDGREVRFCCGGCIGKFEADQAGYWEKIDKQIVADQIRYYPTETCVVSGEPLAENGEDIAINMVYGNRLVRLCCKMCEREFKADPKKFIAKLDKAAADAQRKDYPMDTCAVAGGKLGSMGEPVEMVVAGRLIRLCCGGCKPKIEADPAKYVTMVDKAWQAEGKFMPKAKEGEHAGDHGDHNHGG